MSEQLLSLYGLSSAESLDDAVPFAALPTRNDVLNGIGENRNFDLLILGGGLTGALIAHEATLQGIRVLLLERGYFGVDALSWDVRIAHQLRSDPMGLIRARRTLKEVTTQRAPHLALRMPVDSHPVPGLIARLVQRYVPLVNIDERLLIRETILAARQEGAAILSGVVPVYVEAESSESGCYMVGFEDPVTQQRYEARVGGIVLDPTHGILPPSRLGTHVVPATDPTSAGEQLIYEAIPKSPKSALRFVSFELTDGSFIAVQRKTVSTLEVTVLHGSKQLSAEQVDGIIAEAVGEAGWQVQREVSRRRVAGRWSSRYGISQVKGVFSCVHRGAWDAFASARTIVSALVALSREPRSLRSLSQRRLPGVEFNCEVDAFRALARAQGLSEQTIERVVARWRGRVRYLALFPNGLREFVPGVLRGEVELAVRGDQVVSLDDLVVGALDLQTNPTWQESLSGLEDRLASFYENSEGSATPKAQKV
jgi:hypothetical protein